MKTYVMLDYLSEAPPVRQTSFFSLWDRQTLDSAETDVDV